MDTFYVTEGSELFFPPPVPSRLLRDDQCFYQITCCTWFHTVHGQIEFQCDLENDNNSYEVEFQSETPSAEQSVLPAVDCWDLIVAS